MKLTFILALIISSFTLNAQTKKDGTPDMCYKSNKETYSSPISTLKTESYPIPANDRYTIPKTSTTTFTSRPAYSGSRHTDSHGGIYVGATNSHHKDGKYLNPNSNPIGSNVYGTHKTTSKRRN